LHGQRLGDADLGIAERSDGVADKCIRRLARQREQRRERLALLPQCRRRLEDAQRMTLELCAHSADSRALPTFEPATDLLLEQLPAVLDREAVQRQAETAAPQAALLRRNDEGTLRRCAKKVVEFVAIELDIVEDDQRHDVGKGITDLDIG
jgi:hypothetical protein